NRYYVDKTMYLPELEAVGDYLFFIRPRRFGKSLFLSMMHYYYDAHYKDRFEELFKGTWIYDNPTEEQNRYMVLSFNFSEIAPDPAHLEYSFLDLVRGAAVSFISRYKKKFQAIGKIDYYLQLIKTNNAPADILRNLNRLVKEAEGKLYVIIDEYDNFTNTILTKSGQQAYLDLTRGEGFYRSFFNALKAGTGGVDAPINRLFITGVSPVTMDDVTSGFNIGQHVSRDVSLNRMLGFTSDDVTDMIEYYRQKGKISHTTIQLMELITHWYGNYRFSEKDNVSMFNSDMILYFMNNYMKNQEPPENLIDRNVRIDYGKLRYLIIIDDDKSKLPGTNGNFSKLNQIMETGETSTRIVDGFPVENITHSENFKSLLFYLGLLTVKGTEMGDTILSIPNETVRRLFYDYIKSAYEETGMFTLDVSRYRELMKGMAKSGEWFPLLQYITGRMKESLGLRDLITGEKAVQTFLNVYLGLTDLFIVHSEKELNNGFADLVMEPFLAKYPTIGYSYLLELKYVKTGKTADSPEVKKLAAEGEAQLKRYALDEKFAKTVGKTKLIKLLLIFSGHKAVVINQSE
ncbi:MAG: AAA family ATPase, partial [bacterium]|nr:AAA family ATPase [bacterium]